MNKSSAGWIDQKRSATSLNFYIGELMYKKGIELIFFRKSLIEVSISEILSLHAYAREFVGEDISIEDSTEIAKCLMDIDLDLSKVDLGKLNSEWQRKKDGSTDLNTFLKEELVDLLAGADVDWKRPVDVILYGFGRIGRLCARSIIDMTGIGAQLRLRAIVTRNNDVDQILKRADLLRMDSVHGPFKGVIEIDRDRRMLIINGEEVQMIAANSPEEIDYTEYGIQDALVIDNTGVWRDEVALSKHIKSKGVSKVLLTAPGKGIPNIVYGVNHLDYNSDDHASWSAASCTTNAIVPILRVMDEEFGVLQGHVETIHAYTNDQNLLDNMHKKHRRGRSAAVNMVITETGAAKAVAKVIPHLEGKLTGSAVRVPTPNGSLAIMNLTVRKEVTEEMINSVMKNAALSGPLRNQIKFSFEKELVSSDIIGNSCCSVFDSPSTKVSSDSKNVVLYAWYDNEFGYTQQVIRLSKYIMNAQRKIYD